MATARPQPTLYEQLEALPEFLVGELLDGALYAHPRPAPKHQRAELRLGKILDSGFGEGQDGPDGWQILTEPEIHFIRKAAVNVPDLAGWRRARMPNLPETAFIETVPDWVGEVLSPGTVDTDRRLKLPIYARFGVPYAWLVDPLARTLETYALADGAWRLTGTFADRDTVRAAPFDALAFTLDRLWG